MTISSKIPALVLLLMLSFGAANKLQACTVCFGDKNDHIVQSISLAIFLMVCIIGFVLGALTIGGIILAKREQKFTQEALGD
ncbi:MAG: hypothetical protein AAGA18_07585 [Verrucomicrobiota bacterium]